MKFFLVLAALLACVVLSQQLDSSLDGGFSQPQIPEDIPHEETYVFLKPEQDGEGILVSGQPDADTDAHVDDLFKKAKSIGLTFRW